VKGHRGFTLIEVLVAMAVLGIASVALFSLISTSLSNLRKLEDLHHYQLAAEDVMNRIQLLQKLPAQGSISGSVANLAADWTLSVAPWYPADLSGKPDQGIMKIDLQMNWRTRTGQRQLHLESLKPATIAYANYDFSQALDKAVPR